MRNLLWLTVMLAVVPLSGCADSDEETGTVHFAITDAPTDDYSSVNVTISRVAVHRSQGADANDTTGWITLVDEAHTVDLIALHENNTAETLGFAQLTAGHYQQLRFYIDNVVATQRSDGAEVEMTVPSGVIRTSGNFDVEAGGNTTLTLEIDLDRSISCNANGCRFSPHIGRVESSEN
jgi:Domain of unknown function (DUF4382)